MNKKNRNLLFAVWLLLLAAIIASMLMLLTGGIKLVNRKDYALIQRYKRLDEVYNTLIDDHYHDLEEEQLILGAIDGMTAAAGDEYTVYFTGEEMQENDFELNGKYSGAGMLLQRSAAGEVKVIRVYEDTPASEAGMLPGDIVISINDRDFTTVDHAEFESLVNEIRSSNGETISIEVLRGDENIGFELTTREIVISNISHCMLDNNIGYIEITQFGGNAVEGFKKAREQLKDASALIIDVRNNPGGLLDDVLAIADELLDGGLIVYMEEKDGTRSEYYAESGAWDIPLAVLVNESSASASEILAAAVQDHERGVVIGTQSYGKGIVQMLITYVDDGAGLQYTYAKYFTPSGDDIHQIGVTPDITVESGDNYIQGAAPDTENDAQLMCAMEYLSEKMESKEYDE